MKQTELLKGVLDIAVVAAVANDASYGYEIVQRLTAVGIEAGDASVYGTLKRLEADGFLESKLVASTGGPARRYYLATRVGKRWLQDAFGSWEAIVIAVQHLVNETEVGKR